MRILVAFLVMAVALAGCASEPETLSTDDVEDVVLPLLSEVPEVSAADLLDDLRHYAPEFPIRKNNVATHEGARQWMSEQFESYGLEVYRQDFTRGIEQANILGIKWGESRDEWIVVGGHYDTTTNAAEDQSQGAYDDGSGTMMTLHLAKAFANTTTNQTLVFVALDGEERGTNGARAFVDVFVRGLNDTDFPGSPFGQIKVAGMVNLDMIGLNWPGVNAPINAMTNSEYLWNEAVAKTDEMGFPEGQIIRKDSLQLGSSDYARFWEVSEEDGGPIPTIFFIADFEEIGAPAPAPSQAHTPTPVGVYPFWHQFDTIETMTAMAGGEDNLEAGFQSATDLAAHMLFKLITDNDNVDAVVV